MCAVAAGIVGAWACIAGCQRALRVTRHSQPQADTDVRTLPLMPGGHAGGGRGTGAADGSTSLAEVLRVDVAGPAVLHHSVRNV